MPLVRKLIIVAAIDGLLLHAVVPKSSTNLVQIRYGSSDVSVLGTGSVDESKKAGATLEAHGVVGLFTIASSSYLIGITGRKQIAAIRGKPIYVITNVALIPLSSQAEAEHAIEKANQVGKPKDKLETADSSDEEDDHVSGPENDEVPTPQPSEAVGEPVFPTQGDQGKGSSVLQDVIGRRGQYGRFAERWFSKKGWTQDQKRQQGLSADATTKEQSPSKNSETAGAEGKAQKGLQEDPNVVTGKAKSGSSSSAAKKLLPKMLKTTKMLLTSECFYFSYDMDITRRLGTQSVASSDTPLSRLVDPLYFWNCYLTRHITNAGAHTFVLPLMQGFVGQRVFTINTSSKNIEEVKETPTEIVNAQDIPCDSEEHKVVNKGETRKSETKDFVLTLISRRSVKRPGLRYLRRGVDDEGNCANTVETEQILSDPTWSASKIYSYTQLRGSIPLYFSQVPYQFKPAPVLHHSYVTNHAAFQRHFTSVMQRYGAVQLAVLVDKHGGEAKIGGEYEKHSKQFNEDAGESKIGWEWFDFHNVCRGMKFENVSILMETLGPTLESYGTSIEQDGKMQATQAGVLRTNCMDCLDRTNVVQSACGQRALEEQLSWEGVTLDLKNDVSTSWFNNLWADNGDAISRQYASTAALKGDYTRTRKRNYRGALNDFGLTINRYFNNIVNDYFSQAAIDFLLGNASDDIFDDFEANMMSQDPATSMRKVRQSAIDTSAKIVIADSSEDLVAGYTLLTPQVPNTIKGSPLEEAVLLLTDAALYAVRFDWNTEKVSSFERIDIRSIVSITRGPYISSVLTAAQCDPRRNVGFLLRYRPSKADGARVNTRSLSTAPTPRHEAANPFDDSQTRVPKGGDADNGSAEKSKDTNPSSGLLSALRPGPQLRIPTGDLSTFAPPGLDIHILAFKMLPARAGMDAEGSNSPLSEEETSKRIVDDVARLTHAHVDEDDVLGLAEARASTGLLEQWGHSLKMLVWG